MSGRPNRLAFQEVINGVREPKIGRWCYSDHAAPCSVGRDAHRGAADPMESQEIWDCFRAFCGFPGPDWAAILYRRSPCFRPAYRDPRGFDSLPIFNAFLATARFSPRVQYP